MKKQSAVSLVLALAILASPAVAKTSDRGAGAARATPRETTVQPEGLVARAYESMYNLDYAEALKTFE